MVAKKGHKKIPVMYIILYENSGQYIISYKKKKTHTHLETWLFKPKSLYQNIKTFLQSKIYGWKVISWVWEFQKNFLNILFKKST